MSEERAPTLDALTGIGYQLLSPEAAMQMPLKLKTHLTLDAPTLENPNILVLTDRIDLDDQISKTFVACGLPNPKQASSVAELRDAVARAGNGQILLSTIFKFAGSKMAIPNSDNWIVLVDECHRTQEKDLGAFLSATLPDARFFSIGIGPRRDSIDQAGLNAAGSNGDPTSF